MDVVPCRSLPLRLAYLTITSWGLAIGSEQSLLHRGTGVPNQGKLTAAQKLRNDCYSRVSYYESPWLLVGPSTWSLYAYDSFL